MQLNLHSKRRLVTARTVQLSAQQGALFKDDEDMIPVAEAYIHAKYKQVAASHDHAVCNKDDVREVLHSILPPVTPEELAKEEEAILKSLLSHKQNSENAIDEDDFTDAIIRNSYWREAGDIVVKELMYFDSVSYYSTRLLLSMVNCIRVEKIDTIVHVSVASYMYTNVQMAGFA